MSLKLRLYGNVTGGLSVPEKLGTAPAMPYKEEIMAALEQINILKGADT